MAGVGQQGQRVGAETVEDFGDDKGGIDRGCDQESRTEVSRGVMVVAVMPVSMAVTMIMPVAVIMMVMPMVMSMVVPMVMFVIMPVIVLFVRHDADLSFFAAAR
ncbi:hypothetical protein [Asticcacaulis solisilvae]|uniref:hypothetical protein n=1 Tax=Asticcacaulis solisilvae TaxID=1217274 RepID=UPI003FD83436